MYTGLIIISLVLYTSSVSDIPDTEMDLGLLLKFKKNKINEKYLSTYIIE